MFTVGFLATIGVIGLAFLLITVIFDGVFDVFGGEPVIPASAFGLSVFGFSGAIAAQVTDSDLGALVAIPAAVGLALSAVFYMVYRTFKRHAEKDENWIADPQGLLGAVARVNWWANGSGEVIVDWVGKPHRLSASSEESFTTGQTVFVSEVITDSIVKVSSTKA